MFVGEVKDGSNAKLPQVERVHPEWVRFEHFKGTILIMMTTNESFTRRARNLSVATIFVVGRRGIFFRGRMLG